MNQGMNRCELVFGDTACGIFFQYIQHWQALGYNENHHLTMKFSNATDHSINPSITAIWMRRTCHSKLLQLGSSPGCTWLKLALVSSGAHARPCQMSQGRKSARKTETFKKMRDLISVVSHTQLKLNTQTWHCRYCRIIVFCLLRICIFLPKALLKVPAGHVGGFALAFAHTFLHEHWLPNVHAFAHAFAHAFPHSLV